jgi:DivIVA domain-containing protein
MELTPQQLCDVEFSEQWRGYNRDQVDDFIERVAAAVSTLQDRLRQMTERAVRAEQRALEGSEADGAARRTLVLAQRTADATVAEAKDTAARLIAQAQEEGRAIILAAENSSDVAPSADPTARAEIADLEVTRSRLQADVAALESHVTDRRARIKGLLDELQLRVDEGFDGRIAQWPSSGDPRILNEQGVDDQLLSDETVDDDPFGEASSDSTSAIDTTSAEVDTISADEEAALYGDASGELDVSPARAEGEPVDPQPPSRPTPSVAVPRPESQRSEPVPTADEEEHELAISAAVPDFADRSPEEVDDDTFFADLRGALDDDAPLGPRDDAGGLLRWREEAATAVAEAPVPYDQGDPGTRKFGRKKRRQR